MKRILLCFLLFLFAGCGPSSSKLGPYSIGRDPTWFPLRLEEMTVNINGFTNALVQELKNVEDKNFQVVDVSWIQLFQGLEEHAYAGAFTPLEPNVITEETYSFSKPFLLLGPVLVVPAESKARSLEDLKNTTVGVYQYDDSVLIVQKHPAILIELYQHPVNALEEVANGKMAGALVPNLDASGLIPSLYAGKLKIVTPPLSDKGLRLVTLKGKNKELIQRFNSGLEKLQKKSVYKAIRNKFNVPY